MLTGTVRFIAKISCGHGNDFPGSTNARRFCRNSANIGSILICVFLGVKMYRGLPINRHSTVPTINTEYSILTAIFYTPPLSWQHSD